MLFVTFHGGSASSAIPCPVNNVYAYDETSQNPTQPFLNVLSVPAAVQLSELRALVFANGLLYVANGAKKVNDVICLKQSSETTNPLFIYQATFVAGGVNSIDHPFGICFDGQGHAYVSSQDTNVVTQLDLSADFQTGSAVSGNAATYLSQFVKSGEAFLDGTFVASHDPVPGFPATPKVHGKDGGLDFSLAKGSTTKMSHSVRDVAICNGILCVADEAGGLVKTYDLATGTFLCAGAGLTGSPIHLLVAGSSLYAAAGSAIHVGTPAQSGLQGTLAFTAQALTPTPPDQVSGMCFDGSGNFYVAVRKQNQIWRYNSTFANGAIFLDDLPDNPEFVVWQASA